MKTVQEFRRESQGEELAAQSPLRPDFEPGAGSCVNNVGTLNRGLIAAMALASLVLVFFRLADYRTFGKHEGFAVVTAREMMTSGDWIIPRFGGVPRLEKPPLAYWVVAMSARLCGGLDEFSARLPAACAALLLAALVGYWAARWYGPVAGAGSAAALISSDLVLTYARRAEVDMLLLLFSTAAMFLIADQPAEERGRRAFVRWIGIYFLLSLAWMSKFHYGPVMTLCPAFAFLVLQRRWRTLLQALNPVGLGMMAAAVMVWSGVVAARLPEARDVWHSETLGRVAGKLGHQPLWFCFLDLTIVLLPWSPIVLLASPASLKAGWKEPLSIVRNAFRGRGNRSLGAVWADAAAAGDSRERYLWIWLTAQFSILLTAADKHQHYLAALVPMLALLAGQGIRTVVDFIRSGRFRMTRSLAFTGTGVLLAVAGGTSAFIASRWPALVGDARLLALLMSVGGTAAIWLLYAGEILPASYLVMGSFLGCYMVASASVIPADDYRRPAAEFARHIREASGPTSTLYSFGFGADPIVYYLGEPARRVDTQDDLERALSERGSLRLVASQNALPKLQAMGEVTIVEEHHPQGYRHRAPQLVCLDIAARQPTLPPHPSNVRHAVRPNELSRDDANRR